MVNHPNRSYARYRFIAWSTITQAAVAHAATLEEVLALARLHVPPEFTEVLACQRQGRAVWTDSQLGPRPLLLHEARHLHTSIHTGAAPPEHTIDSLAWPTTETPKP